MGPIEAATAEHVDQYGDVPLARVATQLARRLDDPLTTSRDAATVSRELRLVLLDLAAGEEPTAAGVLDEIAQRREARRAR